MVLRASSGCVVGLYWAFGRWLPCRFLHIPLFPPKWKPVIGNWKSSSLVIRWWLIVRENDLLIWLHRGKINYRAGPHSRGGPGEKRVNTTKSSDRLFLKDCSRQSSSLRYLRYFWIPFDLRTKVNTTLYPSLDSDNSRRLALGRRIDISVISGSHRHQKLPRRT